MIIIRPSHTSWATQVREQRRRAIRDLASYYAAREQRRHAIWGLLGTGDNHSVQVYSHPHMDLLFHWSWTYSDNPAPSQPVVGTSLSL